MLNSDPKNQMVINPCFRHTSFPLLGIDAQQLTDDLAAALKGWAGTNELTVKTYDLEAPKPNYPIAQKTLDAGTYFTPTIPPELAVCLSFYGGQNVPRKRGRLYLPAYLATASAANMGREIPAAVITKASLLPGIFSSLGGVNVDWIVWSRVALAAAKVSHFWVDNAWDIQRSRGTPPTTKVIQTTSG